MKLSYANRLTCTGGFCKQIPFLVDKARMAANGDAYSYRDFNVGAVGYGVNDATRELDMQSAGNVKRNPGKTKVCAEKRVLGRLEKSGMTRVIGFVGVGASDPNLIEEVTGRATPTLHPCSVCLDMFRESRLVDTNTLVVNAGIDKDIYEVHSVGEQWRMYGGDEGVTASWSQRARYGFDDLPQRLAIYAGMVQGLSENLGGKLPSDEMRAEIAHLALTAASLG